MPALDATETAVLIAHFRGTRIPVLLTVRCDLRRGEIAKIGVRTNVETPIVAEEDGVPLQPNSLTHEFVRLLKAEALPKIRFHDLRHTHASHLLANGVHPKVA